MYLLEPGEQPREIRPLTNFKGVLLRRLPCIIRVSIMCVFVVYVWHKRKDFYFVVEFQDLIDGAQCDAV